MREAVRAATAAPLVNLCTVGAGATTLPSGGWTWQPWPGTGGAATTSVMGATWSPTGRAIRSTWTTAPTTAASGDTGVVANGVLTPGQTYYFAVTVVASKSLSLAVYAGNWTVTGGAGGSGTGTYTGTGTVAVTAGQPTTFWLSFTPGAGTTGCKLLVQAAGTSTWAAGDTLDASCAVVVATTSTAMSALPYGGYFDGSGIGPVTQPVWTGTANASASVAYPLRADAVVNLMNLARAEPSVITLAQQTGQPWSGGTPVLRSTPTGSSNDCYVRFEGDQNGLRLNVQPGLTYTLSATCYLPAAQVSATLHARARTICVWAAPTISDRRSTQAPNVAGSTRLSVTFTVPAGCTSAFYRLYNGSDNAADVVYWGGISLVQGSVAYPLADGSVPGWTWEGAPGLSPSHGPPYTVAALNTGGQRDDTASAAGTALSPATFDPVAQGVTLGSVIDVPALLPFSNTSTIAVYGTPNDTPANSQISHRLLGTAAYTAVQARRTGGAGPQVQLATAPGRYVLASGIRPGGYLTVAAPGRPVTAESAANMVATNGWYQVLANDAYHTLVRTLLVAGWDDNNMWKLMGWLARQAGVTPPLEEIAGSPLAANTTPGTSVAFTPPAATTGRTLYVTFQTTAPATTGSLPYASFGNVASPNSIGGVDQLAFRHGGLNYAEIRYQSHTGAAVAMGGMPAETVGVHVGAVWMLDGDLGYGAAMDGTDSTANPATQAASGGLQGSPHYLNVAAAHAAGNALAAYVFTGTHDKPTRLRITAWLARQYGATAPTGY